MRPLAPPPPRDANLLLISLIIGCRSNIFVIDALNRLFQTQIKNDSHDVCLQTDFSLALNHFLLARWTAFVWHGIDRKFRYVEACEMRSCRSFLEMSSKIRFYIVNYRSSRCKNAYLIIEMSNLNEGSNKAARAIKWRIRFSQRNDSSIPSSLNYSALHEKKVEILFRRRNHIRFIYLIYNY